MEFEADGLMEGLLQGRLYPFTFLGLIFDAICFSKPGSDIRAVSGLKQPKDVIQSTISMSPLDGCCAQKAVYIEIKLCCISAGLLDSQTFEADSEATKLKVEFLTE